MEIFDKEAIYDNQISPLVRQIVEVCKEHQIPMIAAFTFGVCPERGPGRCMTVLNDFEGREDLAYRKAQRILNNGGHEVVAFAIGSST